MNCLISILIPVYNRQNLVKECVASVLAQTYQNFEIILIDDGSTDQTVSICRQLANNDSRIRLLEENHGGVSAARNKGLEITNGDYVFFLDSDDVIHPFLLEELLNSMEASGAPMGGTCVASVSEHYWNRVQERLAQPVNPCGTTYHDYTDSLEAIFRGSSPLNMIGGVMFRRDWIGQTRFREDLSIGEDFYFIYENLIKGASSVFLNEKRYYSRLHKSNTSWDYSFTGFWSRFARRELVWKSEEKAGRMDYAKQQKQEALYCFLRCLKEHKLPCEDVDKMRHVMKDYKNTILPALSWKAKIRYYLSVYMPGLYLFLSRVKHRLKAFTKKHLSKSIR